MKYFYDTEFLEGKQDKRFFGIKYGETNPTIDLISIGIVSEDGREYYAISKDFNLKEAWNRYDLVEQEVTRLVSKEGENGDVICYRFENDSIRQWKKSHKGYTKSYDKGDFEKVYWLRENVLKPIYEVLLLTLNESNKQLRHNNIYLDEVKYNFTYKHLKYFINRFGKSNEQIKEEVYNFCSNDYHKGNHLKYTERITYELNGIFKPELYGYYSDYDHVVFCWLFGKMINLPKGFPMYTKDLKQGLDEKAKSWSKDIKGIRLMSFSEQLNYFKLQDNYPKETNSHSAIHNARWNKELYKFIQTL